MTLCFFCFSGGFQHQNFSPIFQAQLSSLRVEQIQPSWHEGKPLEYYAFKTYFLVDKTRDLGLAPFLRIWLQILVLPFVMKHTKMLNNILYNVCFSMGKAISCEFAFY